MLRNQQQVSVSGVLTLSCALLNAIVLETAFTANEKWYWALTITMPALLLSVFKLIKSRKVKSASF